MFAFCEGVAEFAVNKAAKRDAKQRRTANEKRRKFVFSRIANLPLISSGAFFVELVFVAKFVCLFASFWPESRVKSDESARKV